MRNNFLQPLCSFYRDLVAIYLVLDWSSQKREIQVVDSKS